MFSKWHCAFFKVDDRIPPTDPSFMKRKKPAETSGLLIESAEREGFEPPVPLGTVVFKTTVIDHSTISPLLSECESEYTLC